ncbi:gamma-glutamylcyclotransferase family protein [Pedobacter sp. UYP1]|uniref:gamma-glutamylcyclotransferase family protein n=1 Tax=Pedobacter sp. UYP1 TaxID=1756396 RepID=UPI00339A7D19
MNTENLFSYGTLQNENVQVKNYGRLLEGKWDKLYGYALSMIEITDAEVVSLSGASHHPMVKYTGRITDVVDGMVFEISADELKRTDEYEVDDYKRVQVSLESGKKAWVYINA